MMCGSLFIKMNYKEKCCDWQGEGELCVGDEANQHSNSRLEQEMKGWKKLQCKVTFD